jgi:hypothetical protein
MGGNDGDLVVMRRCLGRVSGGVGPIKSRLNLWAAGVTDPALVLRWIWPCMSHSGGGESDGSGGGEHRLVEMRQNQHGLLV